MASKEDNKAVAKICAQLNDSEIEIPGTNLRQIYKTTTIDSSPGQEV